MAFGRLWLGFWFILLIAVVGLASTADLYKAEGTTLSAWQYNLAGGPLGMGSSEGAYRDDAVDDADGIPMLVLVGPLLIVSGVLGLLAAILFLAGRTATMKTLGTIAGSLSVVSTAGATLFFAVGTEEFVGLEPEGLQWPFWALAGVGSLSAAFLVIGVIVTATVAVIRAIQTRRKQEGDDDAPGSDGATGGSGFWARLGLGGRPEGEIKETSHGAPVTKSATLASGDDATDADRHGGPSESNDPSVTGPLPHRQVLWLGASALVTFLALLAPQTRFWRDWISQEGWIMVHALSLQDGVGGVTRYAGGLSTASGVLLFLVLLVVYITRIRGPDPSTDPKSRCCKPGRR